MNLSHTRVVAGLAVLGATVATMLAPPADAAEPSVVAVLDTVTPAVTDGGLVTVTPDGALAVVNPGPVPLTVPAPDGRDVVRVSAAGVEVDAAHPFTYETRNPPGIPTRLPKGVTPDAAPRWTPVSQDVSWRWYDPRIAVSGVRAPSGGRTGDIQVLSTWSVPVRHGGTAIDVRGRIELRQPTGGFRVETDPTPAGVSLTVAPGPRPSAILAVHGTGPVAVAGLDGEPFLRRTADGSWQAELSSRTYRLNLLLAGHPVPAGSGWRTYAGPGPVGWTDERLVAPPGVTPDAPARWSLPVVLGDRTTELTGAVRAVPRPGTDGTPAGSVPTGALIAAVALLGIAGGALALRHRRPRPSPPSGANAR
ncbi:hypothetical protein [Pseudonocardia sp. HH130629-09]|uniref:hypothetical protein n=1 Tax=Pseudonocardia sp. HH130629-09 TaxID=1641402 RepID=UPI0006CB5EC1|nr:hypothetical protein [Pseudonocardia sp. HH130629-09]ALE84496.1 hypothetical protein XF36_16255 [Pseudonocardia sp. HH130629-09]